LDTNLELLFISLKKARRQFIIWGIVILIFGFPIIAKGKTEDIIVGCFIAAFGLVFILGGWLKYNPSKLLKVLTQDPEEVVWVYHKKDKSIYEFLSTVYSADYDVCINLSTGQTYEIEIEKEHVKTVIEAITNRAPHAIIGYSRDRERDFRTNPKLFLSLYRQTS